ncbi:MAG: histidine phosphatase family protein [Pleurocapsa sp. MO_192.B19]|nr:histidine phosphatase family protein [Pleurocapsa sp. MO_192.B19]
MNREFYILRHCQATGQAADAQLTETGKQQAIDLINGLSDINLKRIISSPYTRAIQSIAPLAEYLNLPVELDSRLIERILSPTPLDDWRKSLRDTFENLDLYFEGGESSRAPMQRGLAVVNEVLKQTTDTDRFLLVTHGNLMALLLKHFERRIGFDDWQNLSNPDIYRVRFTQQQVQVIRVYSDK